MAPRDIDRLQGEIEELFADLWQVPRFAGIRAGFRPAVDCFFTEDPPQLVVVVELAGVDPDSIELSVEERALTISGSRARPRVPGQVYQQAEIEYGRFERRIPLEQDIDAAAASAAYDAGMLRITLPVSGPTPTPVGRTVVIVVRRTG
jgi:HSP20 family protein